MFWKIASSRARRLPAAAVAAALSTLAALPARAAEPSPAAQSWWNHIAALADDAMQGRLTGTAGYDRAAAYVAARFKQYGLKPAGSRGYMQPVRFKEQKIAAERSSVALVDGSGEQALALGDDLILGARVAQPATVEAPLVFIGYGLHIPQAGHDDFSGADLRGRILVVVNGGPASLSAALKSSARAARTWRAVERAGALGVITLPTPKSMDIPWARQKVLASQGGMYLADPALQETSGPRFTATMNPDAAEKLFRNSGHTFAEVLALADAGAPITGFDLKVSLKAKVAAQTRTVASSNILAVLPGSDPMLAQDFVVVSAHLDHLGVGEPIGGDRIYNGAMDDASGVATVLEVARTLAASGARPKRSILFAVFTAEEKGLLGSRAFAERPTTPKDGLVADINMDMFLPLWPLRRVMIQGIDESSLGVDARAVAAAQGLEVTTDPYPDRNSFTRTDQFSFVRNGVPALSLKFGFAPGSAEQQMEKDWRTERYHSPSDDLGQPVDLEAAARFNDFVRALTVQISDRDARPAWLPSSVFAPPPPRAQEFLTIPLEMPLGRRPQRGLPGYG